MIAKIMGCCCIVAALIVWAVVSIHLAIEGSAWEHYTYFIASAFGIISAGGTLLGYHLHLRPC